MVIAFTISIFIARMMIISQSVSISFFFVALVVSSICISSFIPSMLLMYIVHAVAVVMFVMAIAMTMTEGKR